ncbi:hypothetical protein NECAME_11143 [Necator americanus]|uniref:Uncharacterized protein n=1 Tax=Necator americanus TaxID=51031 RepID=W2T5L2_NECAM|nr:hypothetical protein NECAME_11143 [Necator americanus]ETN77290.1 hypothetical protein NECAME_11143 [Necator americanus]
MFRNQCSGALYSMAVALFGIFAMLFWQFTQFAFFTQVGCLFIVYAFDFVPRRTMETLLNAHLVTFVVACLMLFGNEMLLTSLYIASIMASLILVQMDPILDKISFRPLYVAVSSSCFVAATLGIKIDSNHVKVEVAFVISVMSTCAIFRAIKIALDKRIHAVLVVGMIAAMAFEGNANIEKQLRIKGEYSNPEQEQLFDWILKKTKPNDVFCGTMPVMANVKLSTLRPILNHPHYEDVGIRERTKKVYAIFSRKPIHEVHGTLKQMGANYLVLQLFNCATEPNKPYCAYRGMWDEDDKENIGRVSNCDLINAAVTQHSPESEDLIYKHTIVVVA